MRPRYAHYAVLTDVTDYDYFFIPQKGIFFMASRKKNSIMHGPVQYKYTYMKNFYSASCLTLIHTYSLLFY